MGMSPLILDVRPALAQGQEPFDTIMQAVGQLQNGQDLLLIAPFEPVPLYGVLGSQGFTHQVEHPAPDEWRIGFSRTTTPVTTQSAEQQTTEKPNAASQNNASAGPGTNTPAEQQTTLLDTRGMEPPEPLLLILNTLETLGATQTLIAHIDREPLLLFPELLDRGWAYDGTFQPDGSYVISIHRPR